MGIGKISLPIGQIYNSDAEQSLADIFVAFNVLCKELDITPGTAKLTASVNITKGQAVNLSNKQVILADAATSIPAVGVASSTAAAGEQVNIRLFAGYLDGLVGLTPNTIAYLGNAGALVFTRPASGAVQGIGYALSSTELFVFIDTDLDGVGGGGGGGQASIQFKDEGVDLGASGAITSVDFVGANVVASLVGPALTVTISSGGLTSPQVLARSLGA